jgi:hypothetical protein
MVKNERLFEDKERIPHTKKERTSGRSTHTSRLEEEHEPRWFWKEATWLAVVHVR